MKLSGQGRRTLSEFSALMPVVGLLAAAALAKFGVATQFFHLSHWARGSHAECLRRAATMWDAHYQSAPAAYKRPLINPSPVQAFAGLPRASAPVAFMRFL
jgi:hypothetical protein